MKLSKKRIRKDRDYYCSWEAGIDVETMYKNDIWQYLVWLVYICKVADQLVHFTQIPVTVNRALRLYVVTGQHSATEVHPLYTSYIHSAHSYHVNCITAYLKSFAESCIGDTNNSPSPPVPAQSFPNHSWYRCQSTFNDYVSLTIPQY